ncbi:MAG: cytochrome C oxidase subunit IV family protein [Candidatus Binatia bacterium]
MSDLSEKIVSTQVYLVIFVTLLILTYVTYRVALIDLGWGNTIVALAIASGKALLVALYFMHIRYSSRLTWVVTGGGLFWLAIMIGLTLSDYLTRDWLAVPGGW